MIHQEDWELLCRLSEYKSISRTAKEMFISQPAITKRLMQLEELFGVKIAVRAPKGLIFTSHGEYLADYARRMVEDYNHLVEELRGQPNMIYGTLHLATSNSLARFMLPSLLGNYKKEHPSVGFQISSDFSFQVSRLVSNHSAQIGFLRGDYSGNYEKLLLRSQRACVVCARPFTLEELPGMPRVDFYADQMSNDQIDHWWYENFSAAPNIAITVKSGSTCREMVRNGLGYAIFLTEDFIDGYDDLSKVLIHSRNGDPIIRNDWMIYRRELMDLDVVASFVHYVEMQVKDCKL